MLPEERQVIEKALELIRNGWIQGDMARDENGHGVISTSPFAKCFCLEGAMVRAHHDLCMVKPQSWEKWGEAVARRAASVDLVERKLVEYGYHSDGCLHMWNDQPERTQQDVIDFLERVLKE